MIGKNDEYSDQGGVPAVHIHTLTLGDIVDAMTTYAINMQSGEPDAEVIRKMALQMMYNLLAFEKKHADYGRGNIAQGGEVGLLIRMNDKIQRMMTLHHSAATPNHESMSDSVNDLAIYGTIMQLVRKGEWPGTDGRWAL